MAINPSGEACSFDQLIKRADDDENLVLSNYNPAERTQCPADLSAVLRAFAFARFRSIGSSNRRAGCGQRKLKETHMVAELHQN